MSGHEGTALPGGPGDGLDPAERLLAREAPQGYLASWARSLEKPMVLGDGTAKEPYLVFRLGEERFALVAGHVREVHRPARVHVLPGRTNEVVRGLVCLRGELHLCASLHALLGLETSVTPPTRAAGGPDRTRMVVVERGAEVWAFSADEVVDVHRADPAAALPVPATVAKALLHYTDGLLEVGVEVRAARLAPERLFDGLARRLA